MASLDRAVAQLHREMDRLVGTLTNTDNKTVRAAISLRLDEKAKAVEALEHDRRRFVDAAHVRQAALAWLADLELLGRRAGVNLTNPDVLTYEERRRTLSILDTRVTVWRQGTEPEGVDRFKAHADLSDILEQSLICTFTPPTAHPTRSCAPKR